MYFELIGTQWGGGQSRNCEMSTWIFPKPVLQPLEQAVRILSQVFSPSPHSYDEDCSRRILSDLQPPPLS